MLLTKGGLGWAAAAIYFASAPRATSAVPMWLQCVLALLLIDFKQYWVHRAQHAFPHYWEFHKVHHAARRLNALALRRTHPLHYFVAQQLTDIAIVLLLGLSFDAYVLGYKVPSSFFGVWDHVNHDFPKPDRPLPLFAKIFVTPNLHAAHHSRDAARSANFAE